MSILGHAIVTIAAREFPQDAAELQAARARVEALRQAFNAGSKILHDHVMEHFAIADSPVNRTRLASLVKKDLERCTLDLRAVYDFCGHRWAYPLPVIFSRSSRCRGGPAYPCTSRLAV